MPQFPKGEAALIALTQLFIKGMKEAGTEFGSPPISVEQLQQLLDQFNQDWASAVDGNALKAERHVRKDGSQAKLADGLKALIRHAEIMYRQEPERLNRFGWGPRKARLTLEAPGEVRNLRVLAEGENWVILQWQPPVEGGDTAVYQIQRQGAGGPWEDIAIAREIEHRLDNQPRGVQLSYRVVAVNKAGFGRPSVTVHAVL